ncbi:MAG: gliding motility-associated C-terminal domain-containing protein [Ferruginibacter sp.]
MVSLNSLLRLLLKYSLVITYIVFLITSVAQAQLCSGSLGDPVVNITFGSGGGNTGYTPTSGYTYTSSTCPNDGSYTITNTTSSCFGGSWHTVLNDHTGGGAFMLVNASYNPGDFFLTTVSDLCPNTTYEFAAWIMNVMNRPGISPNLTFSIETPSGTILQTYSTGDIAETSQPRWEQYGFFFNTPSTNAVIVLRITNNAPGGIGNDLAMDDITFRPCGKGFVTTAILGNMDVVNICEGSTNTYDFSGSVSSGFTGPVFQWQLSTDSGTKWKDINNANALTYQRKPTKPGLYWYRLTVAESSGLGIPSCRVASNMVIINVHPNPIVNAGPDKIMFEGDSVTIEGTVLGESPIYFWDPHLYVKDVASLNTLVSPPLNMNYNLLATSAFGCKNADIVLVKVVNGIYVPNAFTPNDDGKNDHWRIPFLDPLLNASVKVFNRLGQLVYHTEGQQVDWDGTLFGMPQSSGTYVYYLNYKKHNAVVNMRGTVLLIR